MQNAAETVQHVQARNCYNLPSQNNRCSVIIVRTQARKQGLCARTHNALNLQLLARKTQPDLPFASVLCDFFICVHFSSFC